MKAAHLSCVREACVQAVYELLFRGICDVPARFAENIRFFDVREFDTEFAEQLCAVVVAHEKEMREVVCKHAPAFPWEHIHLLDRAILLTGLAELYYMQPSAPRLLIHEYVEIAKQYGGDGTRKFVNGVLGNVYRELTGDAHAQ